MKKKVAFICVHKPDPDIAISMGCDVGCPFIGRPFDDDWDLMDPTGKGLKSKGFGILMRLSSMCWSPCFYNPYPEIHTEKDIVDLEDWVAGRFHDAYISEILKFEDELYVYFKGMWGCDIEIWFSGEVSYDTSSRNPDEYDPYWGDSIVFFHDGFVYLIDDEYATIENVRDGWCWFKARHMKYHVIPE